MTTYSSQFTRLTTRLQRLATLTLAICATSMFAASAQAQTNATAGSNQGNATNAAAGEAGSTLTNQNVFSSTSDTVGEIGNNDGRFTTNRLSSQPLAGGNTNATQQNAFNNARNLQRFNQQFNRSTQNRNFGNNTRSTRTIRPSLRLGFIPKPRRTEDLQKSVDKRMNALQKRLPSLAASRSDYAMVKFNFGKPGEIVLSGNIPSEDAASLLTNILRMEPGVLSVQNNLKIVPPKMAK